MSFETSNLRDLAFKAGQRLVDALICACAWGAAYELAFAGAIPRQLYPQMLEQAAAVAGLQLLSNVVLGIYRYQWRYVTAEDALHIARAYVLTPMAILGLSVLLAARMPLLQIPVSVIAIAFVLAFCGAVGARILRRLLYQHASAGDLGAVKRRFLLVGAGSHGAVVAREMLLYKGIEVVGFVDDDPGKRHAIIAGVPVIGGTAEIPKIVTSRQVNEILVCISPKSLDCVNFDALAWSDGTPVRSRIVPRVADLLDVPDGIATPSMVDQPAGTNGHGRGAARKPAGAMQVISAPETKGNGKYKVSHPVLGGNGNGNGNEKSHLIPRGKTIVITGGGGFIGSSLAEKLADENRLILVDQSFAPAPIQYTSLPGHPNVTTIQGSILDLDLQAIVQDADIVVHAAAILGVNRVCNAARETLETNYVGTSRLLKALDNSRKIERFIYFSTSEVFGVNSYRVNEASQPSIGPIAESRWSYAMSKLAGEHLVASYRREMQLPMAIVRPFNIFGPRRTGEYALRRFILNALRNQPLEVHGDGMQIRSWCFIEDFCTALLQMMTRPEAVGEDFNIGNPSNTLTVADLANRVIQLTGSSSSIVFCEAPFPDISIRVPSLEKAWRLLSYAPRYDLNTGLELTIAWCRENLDALQAPAKVPAASASVAA